MMNTDLDLDECECDCHDGFKNHIMSCCQMCPRCGKNIILSRLGDHLKEHDESDKGKR